MTASVNVPVPDAAPHSRISRGIAWAAVGAILRYALAGITTLTLTRLLSPRDIGLVAISLAAGELIAYIATIGFHDAIIQRADDLSSRYLDSAFWSITVAAGGLALLMIGLAGPIAAVFDQPLLHPLLIGTAAAALLRAAGTVPRALLAARLDFRTLALARAAGMGLGAGAAIACALHGGGAWSWVLHAATVNATGTIIALRVTGWRPTLAASKRDLPVLWSFALSVSSFTIVSYVIVHADDQLIGYHLGPRALGYYALAYSVMAWPVRDVLGGIAGVLYPVLARRQHDLDHVRITYLKSTQLMACFALPIFAQIIVAGPRVLPGLLGSQWTPITLTMQILAVNGMRETITMLHGPLFRAVNRPHLHALFGLSSGACYITAFVTGLDYGIEGVALFFTLTGIILLPVSVVLVLGTLHMSPRQWITNLLPAVLSTLVMVMVSISVAAVATPLVGQAAACAAAFLLGGLSYLASVVALAPHSTRIIIDEIAFWRRHGRASLMTMRS